MALRGAFVGGSGMSGIVPGPSEADIGAAGWNRATMVVQIAKSSRSI